MAKIIGAINMTIDGFCDHTAITPDDEIHNHYANLIGSADTILYGRITYQLMQFWQALVENPSGEKSMDDFALAMDKISKVVFSHTLNDVDWHSAKLEKRDLKDVVLELKQEPGKEIFVGSRSLIIQLLNQSLIDELQLCVHPVVAGGGLPLFEKIRGRTHFKLVQTKSFSGGAVIFYYEPTIQHN